MALSKILVSLLVALIGLPVVADANDDRHAQIMAQVSDVKARLNVTDEQAEQLEPIFLDSSEKRFAVLEKYGISGDMRSSGKKIGFAQLRAVKRDMDKIDRETKEQLVGVLSERQLNEYKKIQQEQRAKVRERMMARR